MNQNVYVVTFRAEDCVLFFLDFLDTPDFYWYNSRLEK